MTKSDVSFKFSLQIGSALLFFNASANGFPFVLPSSDSYIVKSGLKFKSWVKKQGFLKVTVKKSKGNQEKNKTLSLSYKKKKNLTNTTLDDVNKDDGW